MAISLPLPLSRPLVSRPHVGLTTGPPRRASEMDHKCYCATELDGRVALSVAFFTDTVVTCLARLNALFSSELRSKY